MRLPQYADVIRFVTVTKQKILIHREKNIEPVEMYVQ